MDPQIIVGLLVDRAGFPLEIGCWEGNKAETATMLPIIRQFQARHSIEAMVVVADAGMLSAGNLKDLDEAGLRFIVGSRATKAPADLASHFRWHGDAFTDGQVIDTLTPRHANRRVENVYVNPGRPRGDGLIRPHPAESREPAIAACAAWQRDPCSGLVTRGFRSVARRRHGGRRRPTRLDSWRFGPRR